MKNYIITILSLCLILSACSKSSTTPSNSVTLNTTESKLLGYWYCSMEADSVNAAKWDTVLVSGTAYINFQDSIASDFPGTSSKAKDCIWTPGFVTAGAEVPGYWFYDEAVQQLNLYGQSYNVSINGTTMVLSFMSAHHSYYYFHR